MAFKQVVFRVHAIQRMFQRGIDGDDVRHVLTSGEVIEHYPNDTPYPSYLLLGWRASRPIHVVAADDLASSATIVITSRNLSSGSLTSRGGKYEMRRVQAG